jgi:hypothetical protein
MKRLVTRTLAPLITGSLMILAGCRDAVAPAPVAPVNAGQPEALLGLNLPLIDNLLGTGDTVVVLQRREPLASNITATKIIGSGGGTLSLPEAGLTIAVPAGAVAYPTVFSVTALAGRPVAYEFGPHGTKFAKPLTMTQDLRVSFVDSRIVSYMHFHAGYFSSSTNLINNLLRAIVSELLPATTDADNMVVRFNVSHFSGYLIAMD